MATLLGWLQTVLEWGLSAIRQGRGLISLPIRWKSLVPDGQHDDDGARDDNTELLVYEDHRYSPDKLLSSVPGKYSSHSTA
jgi:hypothetical protein